MSKIAFIYPGQGAQKAGMGLISMKRAPSPGTYTTEHPTRLD
ncbi:hypothetical protein LAJLEIBI_02922 [[Clostridium] hylemonae DSM 15053]|nr:hypothetical protein LAJLEIBI_02922 [[Clostridium] hylemonae DSM 15053]